MKKEQRLATSLFALCGWKMVSKSILPLLLLIPLNGLKAQSIHKKLAIDDLFALAETNSRSLRTFDLAEKQAQEEVSVAKNSRLPSLDISLAASYLGDVWMSDRDFSNGHTYTMPHFGNNYAVEASQIVYAGGAISNSIALAKLQQQVAQLDKVKNRQDIRFLLAANYLELYKLYNEERVYLKNIDETKKLLAEMGARQKEGVALKNDIIRYELQLKTIELVLTQIQNQQTIVNNQLVTVLQLPQETVIDIDTTILNGLPNTLNEKQWQEAAAASPSLKQARIGVEQAQCSEKIVKAERLPSVALVAGDKLDGPITTMVPTVDYNVNYWYVGVGIRYNLASIYTSGKKIKTSRWATQRASEGEKLLQDNLLTDVKAAYIHFTESFTTLDTEQKSLELANQNYMVVNNRYLNDLALITDMLDASNSKLNAELSVVNAQINVLFNYYRLRKTAENL